MMHALSKHHDHRGHFVGIHLSMAYFFPRFLVEMAIANLEKLPRTRSDLTCGVVGFIGNSNELFLNEKYCLVSNGVEATNFSWFANGFVAHWL